MAFIDLKTVPELIIGQILKSYQDLTRLRELKLPPDQLMVQDQEMYEGILTQSFSQTIRMLQRVNVEKILVRKYLESKGQDEHSQEKALIYLMKKKSDVLKVKTQGGGTIERKKELDEAYFKISQIKQIISKDRPDEIFRQETIGISHQHMLKFKQIRAPK